MNYEVIIEDMQNLMEPLVLYWAEKGSLSLRWLGGDSKTQPLVPAEFNFSLEVYGAADAEYDEYFTADETRYRVTKRIETTQEIVYQGFLLPESYSEPYESGVLYVYFRSVDGIGLLKGKKLPASWYQEEHFVTDVIAQILSLTGLEYEICIAPAIKNHLNKKYHQIVIDGRKYYKEDKLPSAYEILNEIVHDMRCQLFQSRGRWYIEGINFRHLKTVNFDLYDLTGTYLGSFDDEKNVKVLDWGPTPNISMVPGLKEVTVTHKASKLELSTELYKDTNIKWVRAAGVSGIFNARHWDYTTYVAKMRAPAYFLELPCTNNTTTLNTANFIQLKEKPYLLKGYKVRVKIAFQLIVDSLFGISIDQIASRRSSGIWIDMMVYKISLNDTVLFYNATTSIGDETRLVFDDNLQADVTLEFVAQENGYLNIQLFEPRGVFTETMISRVRLSNLSVEDIDQKDDFVYVEEVNPESSQVRDIDLEFSDDISTNSKAFYLEKIREFQDNSGYSIEVPIRYGRQQNGKYYSIVSVEGAVLIEQFPEFVSHKFYFNKVSNPKVIYNLNGGEEMAIETEGFYQDNSFYVDVKRYKPATIDRVEWMKWSDAVYNVEQKPYAQVVAEIESKLFKFPHLMITGTAQNPLKFNDLILFKYDGKEKFFIPTDLEWNGEENESQVTLVEGVYSGQSLGDIPPFVDAGPDFYLEPGQTSVQISEAVTIAPAGYIESLLWEKIQGDSGETFASNSVLNPLISGLTGNSYEFQLNATSAPSGLTSSDTMRILRRANYEILYDLVETYESSSQNGQIRKDTYSMTVAPEIPSGVTINLTFKLLFEMYLVQSQDDGYGSFRITKNGFELYSKVFIGSPGDLTREIPELISFNPGDDILLYFEARVDVSDLESAAQSLVRLEWTEATFVNGIGVINNLPAVKEMSADI